MHITNCGLGVHRREIRGVDGLRKLPSDWYAFTNLDLAIGPGRSREIDVILAAEDRIFLIDLKDWSGRIESSGGNWLHNGRDTGASPVGKIHQNAKEVGRLLAQHLRRFAKGVTPPRVVGLVVITGQADLTQVAETEAGSVVTLATFVNTVVKAPTRVATFGGVPPLKSPLTAAVWKDQLSKFFNSRTGPIRPGQRRYGPFLAASDRASYEHPQKVYAEYEAIDENSVQNLGTLRIWDFTKADTRFQTEEARREIAGRERSVADYLRDRGDACETAILHSKAEDSDRGVSYWEVYDRRQRMKRLSEFAASSATDLSVAQRTELARQIILKVSALHAVQAAHRDLGGHSIWLEAPSSVRLSHLMAAQFADVKSLGATRFQFLSSAELPEDVLGAGEGPSTRKDVFLIGASVHWLVFGRPPAATQPGMPCEWSPSVDADGTFSHLHPWFAQCLAWDPEGRFRDAIQALDAFNEATSDQPGAKAILEGLERFRGPIRSQKQLFAAYPELENLQEGDRSDVWRSEVKGIPVVVKMWKRAAWGDQAREGPRILDFLNRAQDLILSPPKACARILEAHWLVDAIVLVQSWESGPTLAEHLASSPYSDPREPMEFALKLARVVTDLHDQGLAHGDLKPHNIVVGHDGSPTLIDLLDFSATEDGEICSLAYAPAEGGRLERDRFAVTRIVEEMMACAPPGPLAGGSLNAAISVCRKGPPENGTLLPLIEALERALAPAAPETTTDINLAMVRTASGPLLPDEGHFFVRRAFHGGFVIRGANEELDVKLDKAGAPLFGRRSPITQDRIRRVARHEFMSFAGTLSVGRTDYTDLSGLIPLMQSQAFIAGWGARPEVDAPAADDAQDAAPAPAFDDLAFDNLAEDAPERATTRPIDVAQLWTSLIEVEGQLTTDGVAQAESAYNRDLKRHVVPFELTSGTFDFNRNDRVRVERLDRKGIWRGIGELDIVRSRPDRVLIDPTEVAVTNQRLVDADQPLRFTSHFEVQSYKRRESATGLILGGNARVRGLAEIFRPQTTLVPSTLDLIIDDADIAAYNLNPTQARALRKLLSTRPLGALQGPPGTGKTLFIAALVHYALTHRLAQNVLLASQSHEAVNNAAEAVLRLFAVQGEPPSILRVGNEGVVSDRLLPYHTDRLEQLYKDRFRAEHRERLRGIGRALGLPPATIEAVIAVESILRPVVEGILALRKEADPDEARIRSLLETLEAQVSDLSAPEEEIRVDPEDPAGVLDDILSQSTRILPFAERPSADTIARLRAVARLGRDFVGSVSTQQRGYEAFLAGTRHIVAGTCVGLGRPGLGLTSTPFDLVVIDEAARCTASELAVPMQAGRWIVLVGDHLQLLPQHDAAVVERVAASLGVDEEEVLRSDFERLFLNGYGAKAGASLKTQYRMLAPIGAVVSDTFYPDGLEPGRSKPEIDPEVLPAELNLPITWVTTDGLGDLGAERAEETGTSRVNPAEADVIVELLRTWSRHEPFARWADVQTKHAHAIGIICMYAAQRDLIRRKVQSANLPDAFRRTIKIDTVDSYQGKENPVVVLSLVRNNLDGPSEGGIKTIRPGFLRRKNRINVAVSRAMDRLVIVGAKSRWAAGGPMRRLSEAVEAQFAQGQARVIPASTLLGEASAQPARVAEEA